MDLNFDVILKNLNIALRLNRTHPYLKRNKKWLLEFATMHCIYTAGFCVFIYNIIYHDLKINQFSKMCKDGISAIVYIVISFQYWVLRHHQNTLFEYIENIKRDYDLSKNFTNKEQDIVRKYAHKGLYVSNQWLVIAHIGFNSFFLKSIFLTIYYYCIGDFRLEPFYEVFYPTVIEEKTSNMFCFLLSYILMFWYALYSAIMYAAYVPIGPIMMLHAIGQLEIVQSRIDELFVEIDDEIIEKKLKIIIKHLQYIYSLVKCTKGVFKESYELSLKASTITLPLALYEFIAALKHGELTLEFFSFIFGSLIFSAAPCYYSDLLMEKGEAVRLSLYSCGWELHYNRRTRTTLQILLQYALRPIAIRTVFRPLCLDTLTDHLQQSYTIFNLMNAMWK